jgi:hypothetical protein
MTQERYWSELYQLKVHINYIELYTADSNKIDQMMKIVLAISSSASIGAWAVWRDLSFVWGSVIASSQIIVAIKPYLPFKARLKAYSSILHELTELFIHSEANWYEIASGVRDEKAINKALTTLRLQKQKILKKYLVSEIIPDNQKKAQKAEERALAYFSCFYPSSCE